VEGREAVQWGTQTKINWSKRINEERCTLNLFKTKGTHYMFLFLALKNNIDIDSLILFAHMYILLYVLLFLKRSAPVNW